MDKLFGMFRKRSRSISKGQETREEPTLSPSRSMQSVKMERSKSTDSLMSMASLDITFTNNNGLLNTFAKVQTSEKVRRKQSGHQKMEKMVMTPYFGHFAGQRIHFDLRRNAEFTVNIKVRTEDQTLASLVHRQGPRKKETVKDECIKFAHEVASSNLIMKQPSSLSFLCEQTILLNLNDIPHWNLPPRYRHQFDIDCQTVTVHVYPSKYAANSFPMKLKKNISVREVQWMLSKRLNLNHGNPSAITLYVKDSLEPLSPISPIPSVLTDLICIIAPSAQQKQQQATTGESGPLSICVSLIGKGLNEIQVTRSTTLGEFEQRVKEKFRLSPDSFLYLPNVLSRHSHGAYSSFCPLRMHALLDPATSSVLLLDHHKRNFPTLHGHLSVSQQKTVQSLLLYKMTVSELDLLKSGPVIGFEVNGPTIPISFKTIMNDLYSDYTHCVFSIRPHAVSVNPNWTIPVLLKYLTCVSGFPCNVIKVGSKILNKDVASDLLRTRWFTVTDNDYSLRSEIPCALP